MLHHKRAPRQPNQKYKLSKLLDCFIANPYSTYTLQIHKGIIRTAINQTNTDPYYEQEQSQYQYEIENNTYKGQSKAAKQFGLFANLIKKMEVPKQSHSNQRGEKKQRKYEYYFQVFKKKQNLQNESNSSNLSQQCFQHIHVQQNTQYKQNDGRATNEGKKPFIDLDFSFDQISNQIENGHHQNAENTANKLSNKNSFQEEQNGKMRIRVNQIQDNALKQQAKNQLVARDKIGSLNFAKLSKELPNHNGTSLFAPNLLNVQKEQKQNGVVGTKRVQSRIIQNNSGSINIDFDIDLNFI